MDKPVSIMRAETMQEIGAACNRSGLPAWALVDIMERMLLALRQAADAEYKRDAEAWEKAQAGKDSEK